MFLVSLVPLFLFQISLPSPLLVYVTFFCDLNTKGLFLSVVGSGVAQLWNVA